jgi:hypothetical protein
MRLIRGIRGAFLLPRATAGRPNGSFQLLHSFSAAVFWFPRAAGGCRGRAMRARTQLSFALGIKDTKRRSFVAVLFFAKSDFVRARIARPQIMQML